MRHGRILCAISAQVATLSDPCRADQRHWVATIWRALTDFIEDQKDAERIEREVRRELDEAMRGAARISEFTVDLPPWLNARPPLTEAQFEVAVALNTVARLLESKAEGACKAREATWEGLSDAATVVRNTAGHLGLPQLPSE